MDFEQFASITSSFASLKTEPGSKGKKRGKNKDESKGLIKAKHSRVCQAPWELSQSLPASVSQTQSVVSLARNHHSGDSQWVRSSLADAKIVPGTTWKKGDDPLKVATLVPLKMPSVFWRAWLL